MIIYLYLDNKKKYILSKKIKKNFKKIRVHVDNYNYNQFKNRARVYKARMGT